MNRPAARRIGSVGLPLPGFGVRIAAGGEIQVRGPGVCRGYWQDRQATGEAFDGGWLRTGDLGRVDEDGFLYLTGRKKDILITAGGQHVVPSVLEDTVREHWLIDDCVVAGDRRPCVVALQQPEASDLRLLVSVLRVAPELERSHDLIVDIARRASHLPGEDLTPRTRRLIEQMGTLASDMWRQAAECWHQRDRSAALALGERNDVMAELYATLVGEIASGGMTTSVTMEMTLIAWFYKRLADHALNIARRVIYLAGHSPG